MLDVCFEFTDDLISDIFLFVNLEQLYCRTKYYFASGSCQVVDSNTPLDWVVRDYVLPQGQSCFVVANGAETEGVVTLGQIRQVPRQRWGWTPIHQIMTPLSSLSPVRATETAYSVLERMMAESQSLLPVVEDSRLLGLVRRDSLLKFAQTRASLGV